MNDLGRDIAAEKHLFADDGVIYTRVADSGRTPECTSQLQTALLH